MRRLIRTNNRKRDIVISVICIVVIALSLSVTSVFLFQHFYYSPFWVSGQSMYPTFNKDAKYKDGTLIGEKRTHSFEEGESDVDYGFMVKGKRAINKIKRFDIIVFEAGNNGDEVTYNIKRVIALPGETFYITSSSDDTNGDLYVLNDSTKEFELTVQPLEKELVTIGRYPSTYAEPTKLGDDEYFVMGDNRKNDNSYDSRITGPIKKDIIYGVAKALNGKATLGYDKKGKFTVVKVKKYWPRYF